MDLLVSSGKESVQRYTQFGSTGRITLSFWAMYVGSFTSTFTSDQWEIQGKFYNKNCEKGN